ncbi:hypothetical protein BJV78DRAFT_151749 [Lactifluus subvellereus]|nr:hypothetical protein BJV78DRAFT_151749 [Lactifluus subvellereus]
MSQPEHQAFDVVDPDETNRPGAAPDQAQRAQNFDDSSGPLFFMYRKMAEEEDDKMAERWQKDADGILIFTGLFSAAVAALLAVTVLDLKQSPQDTSAFYLEQIYQFQVLADSNASRPSTPVKPPSFSAPKYSIWVNSLWFLSLAISLTGAMLATLQQQWARRYLRMTQPPRSSPHERARMREFFANGVVKLRSAWVVEAVPTLIHISLFLFFAGLLVYLFNTNHTVFISVACWVGVSGAIYILIAFMPIIRLDSPYRAPLSSPACRASAGILYLLFGILGFFVFASEATRTRFRDKSNHYRKWVSRGVKKMTEEVVRESSSEIDGRVLKWTFDTVTKITNERSSLRRSQASVTRSRSRIPKAFWLSLAM